MTSNQTFESTPPKKKRNWLVLGGIAIGIFVFGIAGLVSLINTAAENAPYKVKCSASGRVYKGGFTNSGSADAAYQEKVAEGMSCSKEYRN